MSKFSPAGGFIANFNQVRKYADTDPVYVSPSGTIYEVKELAEVDDFIICVQCKDTDGKGEVTFFGNISNFVFRF